MNEDPAQRRVNGGGKIRYIFQLDPMSRPEVISTPNGPAVAHSSDFSPVSAAKPAAPGEILSLFATGLGPTRPGVDPGQPFPANPLAAANSPIEVTVIGKYAEVLGAVGYPGAVAAYQVNFRVPPDTTTGAASIQVSAAWIPGAPVKIQFNNGRSNESSGCNTYAAVCRGPRFERGNAPRRNESVDAYMA
jgi:uncharacterized protein (TIGR03437 family)